MGRGGGEITVRGEITVQGRNYGTGAKLRYEKKSPDQSNACDDEFMGSKDVSQRPLVRLEEQL
jgi:hypothetical protein